ncbi:PREDICTED: alpha-2,8-sialyltransferase 8B-like [Branchiostoma belcheri]|uniref:Alpha-2,8-sialyltransferase 8B-like n=1 Tax=Branchiostoma belcheri TaxID=7741 RepID=A0A6P4ZE95_BRABE|nr:PREDICTED: alpha-2,8-sialyltransferase 8B-like [Branchiostoma belcheri]
MIRPLFHATVFAGVGMITIGLLYVYKLTGTLQLNRVFTRRLNLTTPDDSRPPPASIEQLMAAREAHFNMTNIWKVQNISRKYFNPKLHIIYFSDFHVFLEKCDPQTFTLRNSHPRRPRPCNVVHTPIKHYRTCAVVGNSGILLHSSCGAEIDAHEFVIRSNLPPVSPYRTDVGSRTDLTSINVKRLVQITEALQSFNATRRKAMLARLGQTPGMVFSYSFGFVGSNAKRRMHIVDAAIKKNNLSTITAFPFRSFLDSKRLYTELVGKQWGFASTGLNTFALASTFCDTISMYGFYPMSTYQNKPVPYHYYDNMPPSDRHDFDAEYAMLRQMDEDGVIRHVVGKCNIDSENLTAHSPVGYVNGTKSKRRLLQHRTFI